MTAADYFDGLYAATEDPWRLASSAYEARKYAATVAAVPGRPARVLEPGCSIGVLTDLLAARCDELVAMDLSQAAVRTARERVAHHPHVHVGVGAVPGDWPDGRFDLVVLSELLYYLSHDDRLRTVDLALGSLAPGGHLLAVHWRHPFAEAPTDGDAVHDALAADGRFTVERHEVDPDYRLDLLAARMDRT